MERDLQVSLPPHPPPAMMFPYPQHPPVGQGLGRVQGRDMASAPRPYPAMGLRGQGRGRKSVPGPCPSPMMRRDRKIVMDPSRKLAARSGNLGMILLLFETPSGFALFSISGIMFRDPDAMENLWANFAEDRKARRVTTLRGFQTFDDKSSAFDPFTGVHEKLKNMIMNCRRPGEILAVGKFEYKAIIQVTLGIPCLYCEKVMEVMWGLKNCMRSLVPQEELELTKEDRLPMSHGLIKFLNLHGFDDVQPEMINDRIIVTASALFDCDFMLKHHSEPLYLLGNLIKRVSHIDPKDWDYLKLATALKVIFCPEVSDYHEALPDARKRSGVPVPARWPDAVPTPSPVATLGQRLHPLSPCADTFAPSLAAAAREPRFQRLRLVLQPPRVAAEHRQQRAKPRAGRGAGAWRDGKWRPACRPSPSCRRSSQGTTPRKRRSSRRSCSPPSRPSTAAPRPRQKTRSASSRIQIVRQLEAVNQVKAPLKSELLSGKWELLYTTSASILQPQMFSEDERSKLVNDAHVYVRHISECAASETYEELLATCEVRHKENILLRNLVMEAKERAKGEDK